MAKEGTSTAGYDGVAEEREMSYAHTGSGKKLLWHTVGEMLRETTAKYSENDALVAVWRGERYSYRRFYEVCCQVAKSFMKLGIAKGDRIAIWATNYPEWLITQFATAMIGAILVPTSPAFREHELEYILKDSESQTLVLISGFKTSDYPAMFYNICPEAKRANPGEIKSKKFPYLRNVILLSEDAQPGMLTWKKLLEFGGEVSNRELEERTASLDPEDIMSIQYTSGTTGFPKGVLLTHHNIVNNGFFGGENLKFTSSDRLCNPLPLYHCFGMVLGSILCITHGATMIIPAEYFDPLSTLKAVEQERCTAIHGVPTMFIAALEHPEFKRFDFSSLRTGIMGGAPCPVEVIKKVVDLMGVHEMVIGYGLTECSPLTTQTNIDDPSGLWMETIGPPSLHTEIKIVDPATGKVVPVGIQGELCCRGYLVMQGYHNKPRETAETIDERGWLHTGDLATMDENGYCRITGRIKDMIIRGGENISPLEIEEFLHTHPMVKDVYVFGVPDKKYSEEIAAWIQLKKNGSTTPKEIHEFCVGKIAHQKTPKYIKLVESYPMTASGKIQKFKMREIATKELGLEEERTEVQLGLKNDSES